MAASAYTSSITPGTWSPDPATGVPPASVATTATWPRSSSSTCPADVPAGSRSASSPAWPGNFARRAARQSGRVVGQGHGGAAGDPLRRHAQTAVGGGVQGVVTTARVVSEVPGDRVPRQPERLLGLDVRQPGRGAHAQLVAAGVVAERGRRVVLGHREADVGTAGSAALPVVHVPRQALGGLGRVVAGRQRGGGERRGAVPVRVLQPGPQAVGRPVAGTAELATGSCRRPSRRAPTRPPSPSASRCRSRR